MARISIAPCRVAELVADPAFPELMDEYVRECAVPGVDRMGPRMDIYEALEATGAMRLLAARVGDELVGFMALVLVPDPHYGLLLGVSESLYVHPAHRGTGAGLALLRAAERAAQDGGAAGMRIGAPQDGPLDCVLARRGYDVTHRVHLRRFA